MEALMLRINSLQTEWLLIRVFSSPLYWTDVSSIHNVKLYTYKEFIIATEDFIPANKIGECGFGCVYKVIAYLVF